MKMTTEGKEVARAKKIYIQDRANHVSPILIVGTGTNTPPSGEESRKKRKVKRKRKKKNN
jgi:hypothetical protein